MGIPSIDHAARVATAILAAIVVPAAALAQVVVRGTLYDDGTGQPVRGTVMLVDPATDGPIVDAVADSLGRFELKGTSGIYQIAAVRSGYSSVLSAPIQLNRGESMTVRVPIAQTGDPAHRISVVQHIRPAQLIAQRDVHDQGIEERERLGTGTQFDAAALARSNATTLGEFLQTVSGFSVGDPSSTASMQMTRTGALYGTAAQPGPVGSCRLGWFVDGRRIDRNGYDPITDGLGTTPLSTVEAVEVYRGISEMPAQFADPDLVCGAVALWLKHQ